MAASAQAAAAGQDSTHEAGPIATGIRAVIRVRPPLAHLGESIEKSSHLCMPASTSSGFANAAAVRSAQSISLRIRDSLHEFSFDGVFGGGASQDDLYTAGGVPSLIENVVRGYNATVFAYGQTGSGKTHTMDGGAPAPSDGTAQRTGEGASY